MNLVTDIAILGAVSACLLALITLIRERGLSAWCFSIGMLLAAAESFLSVFSLKATTAQDFLTLQSWKINVIALLPVVWLVFSLTYARGSTTFLRSWSSGIVAAFAIPLFLITLFREHIFVTRVDADGDASLAFGWAGLALHMCLLATWVLVLMNLERTIRASVGVLRWQIKYMILGLVTFFVARLYTSSQTVLFRSSSQTLDVIKGWALFIACISIAISYARTKPFKINVYPSHTVLSGSIVGLLAGIYLVVMGVLAKVVTWLGGDSAFPINAFIVLISFFGVGVVLLSERLRQQVKHWVSRNFRRSLYDYRQLWMTFTARTGSIMDEPALCREVVKWISETFNVMSVTVWLVDDSKKQLRFGASTSLTEAESEQLLQSHKPDPELLKKIASNPHLDLDKSTEPWAETLKEFHSNKFRISGHRLCIRLLKGEEFLGLFTIGDRVYGIPYSLEDFDLLKCASDQIASSLHQIQMSRRLLDAKEMATFQTMSAFFVHDLKNTASTLSLMLQNLPVHFDDPAFRQDALRAIGKSAERINELIARLTQLRQNAELNLVEKNLNDVVASVVRTLKPACQSELIEDLRDIPKVPLDAEQFQKVATNLILNANDASGKEGRITVTTRQEDGSVVFSVSDNGCGMTPDFIKRSLFRPFQTSKKKGIGIGLFHTKMIVEARRGKIEVESEVGKGTTSKVLLPLNAGKS